MPRRSPLPLAVAAVLAPALTWAGGGAAAQVTSKVVPQSDARATVNLKAVAAKPPAVTAPAGPRPVHPPRPAGPALPEAATIVKVPPGTDRTTKRTVDAADTFEAYGGFGPHDTNGAVGPAHVVTALNGTLRVHDKSGKLVADTTPHQFWAAVTGPMSPFDPRIVFDPLDQRWVYTSSAMVWGTGNPRYSGLLVGASKTDDPTGDWYLHRIDIDPGQKRWWIDTPQAIGVNKNWVVHHAVLYPNAGTTTSIYRYYVIDKRALYAGGAGGHSVLEGVYEAGKPEYGSACPCLTFDPAAEDLFLVREVQDVNQSPPLWLQLLKVTGRVGGEQLVPVADVKKTKWTWRKGKFEAPQLGTTATVSVDYVGVEKAVHRNGRVWCVHGIQLPETPARASVQWWELAPDGTVAQQGLIDDPAGKVSFGYPSLAVNKRGDVLVGYSRFAADQHPSANYAYRRAGDPASTLRADAVFRPGGAAITSNRMGDYSAAATDPADDLTLWTLQEFLGTHPLIPTASAGVVAWKKLAP